MRVLAVGNMYPPHHLGGYEVIWRSAVEHLRRAGHGVRILTTDFRRDDPDPAIPEDGDCHRELRWYWRDHDFPHLSPWERLRLERHNAAVLDRHLREFRPDVLSWWALGGMSLSLVERGRRAGLPAVGVVGDNWMAYAPLQDAWSRSFAQRPRVLARAVELLVGVPTRLEVGPAARWLFISETLRRFAVEGGWDLPRSEIAHPGVDHTLFRPAQEPAWRWRLLYAGRVDERKGIDTAVEALEHLPPEAHLTVDGAGDESHLSELRELAGRLGVVGRVDLVCSARSDLPGRYEEADAVLFPVRWEEPWGLVPLEAMAVGTPVVATGRGGSGEYLRDGENALVLGREAGPADFAEAVHRLAADPELRARLREGGFATAQRFDERSYNDAIAAALEEEARRS
jgi:glycosyltransferase involved in cell wall biosynthesis